MYKKNISIYDNNLYVTFDKNEYKKIHKKIFGDDEIDDAKGITIRNYKNNVYVYINLVRHTKESDVLNTISHESFHVAYSILKNAGCFLDDSSEESYSYLVGYITEYIYLCLLKHKGNNKN